MLLCSPLLLVLFDSFRLYNMTKDSTLLISQEVYQASTVNKEKDKQILVPQLCNPDSSSDQCHNFALNFKMKKKADTSHLS